MTRADASNSGRPSSSHIISTSRSRRSAIFATARTRIRRPRGTGHVCRGSCPAGFGHARILQGKELSYTNLLDLDAAARIALEFTEPAAVVIKHTNPCGAAIGELAADAYVRARDADSLAAFGGIVALNRPIDAAAADAIVSTFIEAVIAPSVDAAARDVLAKKANMRVVTADFGGVRAPAWTSARFSARCCCRNVTSWPRRTSVDRGRCPTACAS